jgi:hypothetical protein
MSERKFPFKIENETHVWPEQFITGAEVRAIPPGIPASMDLFIKKKGMPGIPVANDDKIDLGDKGLERFYYQVADSTPGVV